jgi:hypothetical protein
MAHYQGNKFEAGVVGHVSKFSTCEAEFGASLGYIYIKNLAKNKQRK